MTFERIRHRLQNGRPSGRRLGHRSVVPSARGRARFARRARLVAARAPDGGAGSLPRRSTIAGRRAVRADRGHHAARAGRGRDAAPRGAAHWPRGRARARGRCREREAGGRRGRVGVGHGEPGRRRSPARRVHASTRRASPPRAASCSWRAAKARGSGLMAAVVAAARTELPTWAVLEYTSHDELTSGGNARRRSSTLWPKRAPASCCSRSPHVDLGLAYLERFRAAFEQHGIVPGVLLAGSESSVRGFHDETSDPERWVERAVDLSRGGARVIGGGAGTTEAHTQCLAKALGSLHPSIPSRRIRTRDSTVVRAAGKRRPHPKKIALGRLALAVPGHQATRREHRLALRPSPTSHPPHETKTPWIHPTTSACSAQATICWSSFSRQKSRARNSASARKRKNSPSTAKPARRSRTRARAASPASSRRWSSARLAGRARDAGRPGDRAACAGKPRSRSSPAGSSSSAAPPLDDIHETRASSTQHLAELPGISQEMNLTWLGIGFHPLRPAERPRLGAQAALRDHARVPAHARQRRPRHDAPHRYRAGELRLLERGGRDAEARRVL